MQHIRRRIDIRRPLKKYDAIMIGADIYQVMRRGYERYVATHYPYVKEADQKTIYGSYKKLGTVIECKQEGSPTFLLMYVTVGHFGRKVDTLEYDKLEECLKYINVMYRGKHLASTWVGTNSYDGNGSIQKVSSLYAKCLKNVHVDIYSDKYDRRIKKNKYDKKTGTK